MRLLPLIQREEERGRRKGAEGVAVQVESGFAALEGGGGQGIARQGASGQGGQGDLVSRGRERVRGGGRGWRGRWGEPAENGNANARDPQQ